MDPAAYARSAKIVATYGKLKKVPGHEAYRTDLATAANAMLNTKGIDVNGRNCKKLSIHVTPGGN
jgi:hypothetical protein